MTEQILTLKTVTLRSGETIADNDRFITDPQYLVPKGRVQFFFHSPLSKLPVRDVTNEQNMGKKTEPFLERFAENYCEPCYQRNNILPFLRSREKYLFLQTTCRKPNMNETGERFIVGYLEKEYALDMGTHYAVKGPISLFAFKDGYPGAWLNCNTDKPRVYKLDRAETKKVLDHFDGKPNVYEECLAETRRLENSIGRVPPEELDPLFENTINSGGC